MLGCRHELGEIAGKKSVGIQTFVGKERGQEGCWDADMHWKEALARKGVGIETCLGKIEWRGIMLGYRQGSGGGLRGDYC